MKLVDLLATVPMFGSLGPSELAEIASIVGSLVEHAGAGNDRLAALGVAWVLKNPEPLPLEKPSYRR